MDLDERGRRGFLIAIVIVLLATLLVCLPNYAYSSYGLAWRPTFVEYVRVLAITYAVVGVVAYGGWLACRDTHLVSTSTRHSAGYAAIGTVITLVVGGALVAIAGRFGLPITQPNSLVPPLEGFEGGPAGPERLLVVLPVFVLVVVPIEEVLFRSVVQTLLGEILPPEAALVGASALFALFTIPVFYGPGVVATAIPVGIAFVLSLVWGDLYRRTHNVLVPIAAHAAPYVVGTVALYLLASSARA